MKHLITLIVCFAVIMPITMTSEHGMERADVGLSIASTSDSKPDGLLGVEQLMIDVNEYKGTFRVEGVVSTVSPQTQMLSLIDTKEYAKCGVVTCSPLSLPVHWRGPMPAVRDTVRVKGEVKEQQDKLILEAQELEIAKPQQGEKR